MDDKQKFALMMSYISGKFKSIDVTVSNIQIGVIKRLFDDLKGVEILVLVPHHMQRHINQRQDYIDLGKSDLWTYTMLVMVRRYLIDTVTNQLNPELIEAIGATKYALMRQGSESLLRNPFEVENAFMQGFLSCIVQYFLNVGLGVKDAQSLQRTFHASDYSVMQTLHDKRIKALVDSLKLDNTNHEHLTYWQQQTQKGTFNQGGATILFSAYKYKVPSRVQAMMTCIRDHRGSYECLIDALDSIRSKQGRLETLHVRYRNLATKLLYETTNLEMVDLRPIQLLASEAEGGGEFEPSVNVKPTLDLVVTELNLNVTDEGLPPEASDSEKDAPAKRRYSVNSVK